MSLGKTGIFAVLALLCLGCVAIVDIPEASAAVETYEIQYVVADTTYSYTGTESSVTLKSMGDMSITVPVGKQMDGWKYSGTTITAAVGSTVYLTSGVPTVFEAMISDIDYTVKFVDGSRTISTATYKYGANIAVPASPTKDGLTFSGWDRAIPKAVTESVTFNAMWKQIYSVAWTVEGVTISTGTTESALSAAMPADPIKGSHTFLGWYDVNGVKLGDSYSYVGDTVFSARFAADVYTVNFVYGDGDTVFLTETVAHGGHAIMPAAMPSGYSGWDWDFDVPVTGDVTITALEAVHAAAFWETVEAQCALIILIFVSGLLVWSIYGRMKKE